VDGIATVVAVAQDHFSGHHVELVGGPDATTGAGSPAGSGLCFQQPDSGLLQRKT
jgi:hypothetical protein